MLTTYARSFFSKFALIFYVSSLMLLYMDIYFALARAPETAKIAFAATPNGNWDVLLMNPDGTQQVNLTNHPAVDHSPVWSPTGEHILFSSSRYRFQGSTDLYLMNPDGSNVRQVFGKSKDRRAPSWSPDGAQIAYNSSEQGQSIIYIAAIAGQKEERVAFGDGPIWSPDGTEIAFTVGWPERMRITVLNVQTRRQKFLFPPEAQPSWMEQMAWSPTGKRLAFSWLHRVPLRDFLETETIYTVNRDGTDLKQIVPKAGLRAVAPVWSPDGSMLLYQQLIINKGLQKEQWQIFKVAAAGGETIEVGPPGWYSLGDWFDPAYALSVSPQPQLLTTIWAKVKKNNVLSLNILKAF